MPPKELMTTADIKELYSWMGTINATLTNLAATQDKSEEQLEKKIDENKKESVSKDSERNEKIESINTLLTTLRNDYEKNKSATEAIIKERARIWGLITVLISTTVAALALIF